MEILKENLKLVRPKHIIPIIENAVDAEEVNLDAANPSEYIGIKHRIADLKIFSLIVTGDLSLENYAEINVKSLITSLQAGIQAEEINREANKCLGNDSTYQKIDDCIRDAKVLVSILMFDLLNP